MTDTCLKKWAALITCASILTGCGGDGDPAPASASPKTTVSLPSSNAGPAVTLTSEAGSRNWEIAPDQKVAAPEPKARNDIAALQDDNAGGVVLEETVTGDSASSKPTDEKIWEPPTAQHTATPAVEEEKTQCFDGKQMRPFAPLNAKETTTASLKFLISAIGPQKLVDHLEKFKQSTQNPKKRLAAEKFVVLIRNAYSPSNLLIIDELKDLVAEIQAIAPFTKLTQAGALQYDLNAPMHTPRLADLLAELFELDEIPGWSIEKDTIYTTEGKEPFGRYESTGFSLEVEPEVDSAGLPIIYRAQKRTLQQILDAMHPDYHVEAADFEDETKKLDFKVIRRLSVEDINEFTRLTTNFYLLRAITLKFDRNDRVTLKVFDRKTQSNMLVTLEPKEIFMMDDGNKEVFIKSSNGSWKRHARLLVTPPFEQQMHGTLYMINFAVVKAAAAANDFHPLKTQPRQARDERRSNAHPAPPAAPAPHSARAGV